MQKKIDVIFRRGAVFGLSLYLTSWTLLARGVADPEGDWGLLERLLSRAAAFLLHACDTLTLPTG